jgi:hypothetical protein
MIRPVLLRWLWKQYTARWRVKRVMWKLIRRDWNRQIRHVYEGN